MKNDKGSDRDPKSVLAHKGINTKTATIARISTMSESTPGGLTVRLPYVATSDLDVIITTP